MNPTFSDFAPLYDFSEIESGVQNFFCGLPGGTFVQPPNDDDLNRSQWAPPAGQIAFYNAFQAETFRKVRPRVYILLNDVSEFPGVRIVDANQTIRANAWKGRMRFGIVTEPLYMMHNALRAAVLAIIPQLQPLVTPDGTGEPQGGINAFLTNHEVGQFAIGSVSTHITPESGNFHSIFDVNLTFSVRASMWPGGTQTT